MTKTNNIIIIILLGSLPISLFANLNIPNSNIENNKEKIEFKSNFKSRVFSILNENGIENLDLSKYENDLSKIESKIKKIKKMTNLTDIEIETFFSKEILYGRNIELTPSKIIKCMQRNNKDLINLEEIHKEFSISKELHPV